ncbi:MAG: TetR/AcrR family transcriptional regulator [Microbacterium sp.]|uniref:TetR/AcrR family transcriptional regulator n=1 Tax=Microbacterium sp. TaxID=51671 RepID=UPI00260CB5A3|nr:TetR/AcrR family transcriptional regulator [Microbacterium sp.]MCX6502462.1 TetR/AcrR family transcriptional regulator [Microbacterium sp.]
MANLRTQQKEQTRRNLLQEALRLFEAKGYVATTIDDIATAVGTTRVTFYAYFPNKTEILRALFDELNRSLDRHEDASHRMTARPLVEAARIGTFDVIRDWIGVQSSRWPEIAPYITVITEAAAVDPEMREINEAWFTEVIDDIVEGLTQAGRFDPETRRFRGYLAMELLDGTTLRWIRHPFELDAGPELDILAQAWTDLLGD